jgi:hypothetical protein
MLADRTILARDLDPLLFIVLTLRDYCSVLSTSFGNTLEFAQEVVVWPPFLINKNPAVMRGVFPSSLQ